MFRNADTRRRRRDVIAGTWMRRADLQPSIRLSQNYPNREKSNLIASLKHIRFRLPE